MGDHPNPSAWDLLGADPTAQVNSGRSSDLDGAEERGRRAGWAYALHQAAQDLTFMAADPTDNLTDALGGVATARLVTWLRDQASTVGVRCPRDALHDPEVECRHPWHRTEET